MVTLSTLNALAVGPLLKGDARRTSDFISVGAFGTGLTLMLLPKHKTYYFQQPQEGRQVRLWKLKE